jgi:hypothetical protein
MRDFLKLAAGSIVIGALFGLLALLSGGQGNADVHTTPKASGTHATAHLVEIPGPTVVKTETRTVVKTRTVQAPPVTVTETRTVQATPGIEEDSAPDLLNKAMDAGGDFRKGPDVDAWANDSDPTGTKHFGCAVVINDTSFGACPDGYTFAS